jgi:hypothetical protein
MSSDTSQLLIKLFSGSHFAALSDISDFPSWRFEFEIVLSTLDLPSLDTIPDLLLTVEPEKGAGGSAAKPKKGAKTAVEYSTPDNNRILFLAVVLATNRKFHHLFHDFRSTKDGIRAYDALHRHCQPRDILTFISIKRQLHALRLSPRGNMPDYLRRFSNLVNRYNSSAVMLEFSPITDREKAALLISSLPDVFNTFISSISATFGANSKSLAYDDVVEKLTFESQRLNPTSGDALFTFPRPQCTFCSRTGHTEDRCWSKHPDLKAAFHAKKPQDKDTNKSESTGSE